jgi:hypothetical protein
MFYARQIDRKKKEAKLLHLKKRGKLLKHKTKNEGVDITRKLIGGLQKEKNE